MSSQIDKIKQEIEKQTNSELESIENEITKKMKDINEATEKEIAKIVASIEESGKTSAENQAKRELGKARLEAKMKFLAEKENGINVVFEEGKKHLEQLIQAQDYNSILSKLIVSGGCSLEGGNLIVNLLKSDSSKVKLNELAKEIMEKTGNETSLTLGEKEPETKLGGAMLFKQFGDNYIWVDNTFEAIINRRRDSIRSEVSKILFA